MPCKPPSLMLWRCVVLRAVAENRDREAKLSKKRALGLQVRVS